MTTLLTHLQLNRPQVDGLILVR